MPAVILEVPTLAQIPAFVPFGVLYYAQDTGNVYIGTGSSEPPNVELVSAGGGGTPAGFNGDIQYNNSGAFGGSAATLDATGNLTLPNTMAATSSGTGTFPTSFFAEPTTAARNDFTGALGFSFSVSQQLTVSSLGRLYVAGNTQNHVITLWGSSTTTPIAQGTILAATASDANGFKFVSVTPVVLLPNQTYAIAIDETSGGDAWKDEWVPSLEPQFNLLQSVFSYTQGTYPNVPNNNGKAYDTAAMAYTSVLAVNQSSPVLNIKGEIWNGASVADSWSIQDVVGSGINPTSTLVIAQTGSSTTAFVSVPNVSLGGALSWNFNTGLSSSGASSLALGNGVQGDFSAVLKLAGSTFAGPGTTFSSGYLTVTEKDNIAGGANLQGYGTTGGGAGTQHSPLTLNGTWLGNSAVPTDTALVQVRGNQNTNSVGVNKGTAIFGVNNDDDFEIFAVYSGEDPATARWGVVGVNTNGTAGLPVSTFQVNNGQSAAYASQPIAVIARGVTGETGDILQLRDFDKSSILAKFDKAANLTLLKNTTATSGTTNASPTETFSANYWTGAASAPDTWTIGSSLAAGTNGASGLTFTHTGSTGAAAVNFPSGSSTKPSIGFSAGFPNNQTGLYYDSSVICAGWVGNNVKGGALLSNGVILNSTGLYLFSSSTANNAQDTGISRLNAASLGIGNASAGDTSGVLIANGGHGISLAATTTISSVAPVKADTSNANQIVVTTTADTGPGIVVGVCINSPGATAKGQVITTGIAPLILGTGAAAIGNFVIVDTTTNGRVKCTVTYPPAGSLIGVAMSATSTVGNAFNVAVGLR